MRHTGYKRMNKRNSLADTMEATQTFSSLLIHFDVKSLLNKSVFHITVNKP